MERALRQAAGNTSVNPPPSIRTLRTIESALIGLNGMLILSFSPAGA